ncbi:MAG: ATP-binding protein [Dehalococcoidales bacterium]|nr:ATP-binding protein [Dehalococcoidales bacterium]
MDNRDPEPSGASQRIVIREKLTRKILRSVMAQFSGLTEAILELVDNAFDEFDGVHGGTHLDVDIIITKDCITIENTGGKGMGQKELEGWLSWGEALKTNAIGEYGQGGKAAMGYLGSAWIVRTKRWDEPITWEVMDNKWDDLSVEQKTFEAVTVVGTEPSNIGYCRFEIRKLKKHRQDTNRLKVILANVYRHYLEAGSADITVNYTKVKPLKLPLYDGFKIQEFHRRTAIGFTLNGWVGRLKRDARVRGGISIVGGMRLLRKGRLIRDGEYFGHHDFRYKASLGSLIGEVEMSRVPVLPNKTGFDTDSPEWMAAQNVMYSILKPHVEELLSQKEEETVTREERKRVSLVREWMVEALKLLSKSSDLSSRLQEDKGRKPPSSQSEQEASETPQNTETSLELKEPRTPPPEGAVGRLRRLGNMPDWELRILQPHIRSDWGDKEGRRCLLINKMYWLFKKRSGDELYIAETAALELAREAEEKLTLEEYLGEVNKIMRAFGQIYAIHTER